MRKAAAGLLSVVVLTLSAATACSESEPQFAELQGWERVEVWGHQDVVEYDRVAVSTGPTGLSWFTRARGSTDTLAYWTSTDALSASQIEVAMPQDPVVIPVAVATDAREGWVAVAVGREVAHGENTAVLAWLSGPQAPRPQRLAPPEEGMGVPARIEAARVGGVNLVTGVADGRVVAWRNAAPDIAADTGTAGGSGPGTAARAAPGEWSAQALELEGGEDLVTTDLASDGQRFVMAGVDREGGAHLWASSDGREWQRLEGDLPADAGSATLLGPLEPGEMLVSWLGARTPRNDDVPRSGPEATVQRISGDRVTSEGVVEARPDDGWPDLSLTGAAVSPEGRTVVVGAAWRSANAITPMVWLRDGDEWEPSSQPELASRLDYEMRAVAAVGDDRLVGLVTPTPRGIDVEVWGWSQKDD
ncbi:MAG TPA: hypothetical protein VIL48_04200 [Acidimicrobiales bacterium]